MKKKVLNARKAFEHSDLTFRNQANGIPENLILSTDKEKIYTHIMHLIESTSMRGEFYLNVMIYGEKQQKVFLDVAQKLKNQDGYSIVVIKGTKPHGIMSAIVSWKNAKDVGNKPYIKCAKINI